MFLQILPPYAFAAIRLIITLCCIAFIIWSGFDGRSGEEKWFIYLTHWSFFMLTVAFLLLTSLSLLNAYQAYQIQAPDEDYGTFETSIEAARAQESIELPSEQQRRVRIQQPTPCKWYHMVTWFFYNVAFCAAIIVSLAYWIFQAKNVEFLDVVTHAFNTIFALIELILGCVPIQLLHFLYTFIYLSVYVIFSVIYWKADGLNSRGKPYIYKILDYNDNNPAVISVLVLSLCIVAPPLVQLAMLGLAKLRSRCFN